MMQREMEVDPISIFSSLMGILRRLLAKEQLGLDKEVQFLSDRLPRMHFDLRYSFLKGSEEKVPQMILNNIRDVVYDIEDVINDYNGIFEEKRMGKWQKFVSKFGKRTQRSEIAERMEDIMKRIGEILDKRYEFEREMLSAEVEGSFTNHNPMLPILQEEINLVGFEDEVQILVNRLTGGGPSRAVISIVGMGGLGKTTLAKKIYNDPHICYNFDYRGFADARGNPQDFAARLLNIEKEMEETDTDKLGNILHDRLKQKKYLIVMDGVWEPQVWEYMEQFFPNDDNGSRILLITRIKSVALFSDSDSSNPPHYLRFLNREESWELFHSIAFSNKTCTGIFETLGRHIAESCGGLPLAITVLGNLLSRQKLEEWKRAARCVSTFLCEAESYIFRSLADSYCELPSYLKPCFLYLSVFPKNDQIPASALIQSWVSEGIIVVRYGRSMEDEAEVYLEMLVDRNLVQVEHMASNPGIKVCSIHCILHQICIREAQKMGYLQENGKWNKNKTKWKSEIIGIDMEIAATEGTSRSWGQKTRIVEQSNMVGIENEAETLVTRLTQLTEKEDFNLSVISIVGMGGLGKTTLARKIYNDIAVREKFEHHAWVLVTQNYSRHQLMLRILTNFTKVTNEMVMNEESLAGILYNKLQGTKYLIVMDDVWEPQVWEDLKPLFPDNSNGSRILLTTRVTMVAEQANPWKRPHYLRFLSNEESWKLFCSKAFSGETCTKRWEILGRQIAKKCGGLPLAIVGLGNLLSEKRRRYNNSSRVAQEQGTYEKWLGIARHISTYLYGQSAECKKILVLSYNDLPYYLKPCLLYLSAFPEDYQIPAEQLIQLWIAEGFVEKVFEETMEDTAKRYLETLVDRGLIQMVQRRSDGGVKTCSIRCLFHDFCISEARQNNFLEVNGFVNSELSTEPRRLAGNADTMTHVLHKPKSFGKLRSLLCFSPTSGKPDEWSRLFKTIRFLRVFKISYASILPDEIEKLVNLRYLGLDKNSLLQLPSSICNLTHLQVLDARSKFIRSAPAEIWKLKKLRHVYFEGPTYFPPPLSQPSSTSSQYGDNDTLTDLQTLSTISAISCTPEVFQRLPNLLRVGIIVKSRINDLSNNLVTLEKLRSLKLAVKAYSAPLISLPLEFPPSLTKLTLSETQLEEDPMPLLGELKNLEILKLVSAYTGSEMVAYYDSFPQLKVLKIVRLEYIRNLKTEEGGFPKLEHLVIHECQHLQRFSGLEHLTSLNLVDLLEPSNKFKEQMQDMQQSGRKGQFQLNVYPL